MGAPVLPASMRTEILFAGSLGVCALGVVVAATPSRNTTSILFGIAPSRLKTRSEYPIRPTGTDHCISNGIPGTGFARPCTRRLRRLPGIPDHSQPAFRKEVLVD